MVILFYSFSFFFCHVKCQVLKPKSCTTWLVKIKSCGTWATKSTTCLAWCGKNTSCISGKTCTTQHCAILIFKTYGGFLLDPRDYFLPELEASTLLFVNQRIWKKCCQGGNNSRILMPASSLKIHYTGVGTKHPPIKTHVFFQLVDTSCHTLSAPFWWRHIHKIYIFFGWSSSILLLWGQCGGT